MLSYLDSRWLLLMEGLGMHKMGRKLMIFAFFFRFTGRFSDGHARLDWILWF